MKKYLSIILVALLVIVSLVVSCKSTKDTTITSTSTSTSTPLTTSLTTQSSVVVPSSLTTTQSSVVTTSKTTPITSTSTTGTSTTTSASAETFAQIMGLSSNITCLKYTMVMTSSQTGSMSAAVYVKNNKMRMEATYEGVSTIVIIDTDAKIMYSYMPDQNMAMKMPYDPSAVPTGSNAADIQSSAAELDPVFIGDETCDGKVCAVFEYGDADGTYKMWVWKDKGLPLKIEMKTGTDTGTIEFKDYDFSDIPDSMFELPAGVQVIEAGAMPTGIPKP